MAKQFHPRFFSRTSRPAPVGVFIVGCPVEIQGALVPQLPQLYRGRGPLQSQLPASMLFLLDRRQEPNP